MKNQAFGIEIELTGITRSQAAEVIAKYFNTQAKHEGGSYDEYHIADSEGRKWKLVSDGSINPQKKKGKEIIDLPRYSDSSAIYKVEFVSPKCRYEDIEKIQEMIRLLRKAGAIANKSCGIHVHVDAANHTAKSLRNLVNIMVSKENLIYKALEIEEHRASDYCKKVNEKLVVELNKKKPQTVEEVGTIWYKTMSNDTLENGRRRHYHDSRYRGLNLHSVYQKGTVEFRLFNSTTHAGEIKTYIQFCLAMSYQAIKQNSASSHRTESSNEKYTFRTWLLRLGMIGEEFETARMHLLKHLEGDIAWRNIV